MIKQSYHYFLLSIISVLITLVSLPIFTKFITPYGFGIIALASLFGSIFANILSFGLPSATYRSFYQNGSSKSFYIVNFTNLIFILIVYFIFFIIIFFYFEDFASLIKNDDFNIEVILIAYTSSCLIVLYNLFTKLLVHKNESKKFALTDLFYKISLTIISIILVFYLQNYWALIYGTFFSTLIFVIYLLYVNKKNFIFNFSIKDLKDSVIFSFPTTVNDVQNIAKNAFDKLYLYKLSGASNIGYLDVANKFGNLAKLFYNSINFSYMPFFMNLAKKKDKESNRKISERYFQIVILFNFVAMVISFFSEEIVYILTDSSFHSIRFYIPLIILNIYIGEIFSLAFKSVIFFKRKMKYNIPVTFVSLSSNIIFNLILIPIYEIWGVLLSLLISNTLTSVLMFILSNRLKVIKINLFKFSFQIILHILFLIIVYKLLYMDISLINKLAIKIICIVAYAIIMTYLVGFKKILELTQNLIKYYKQTITFKNKI